MQPWFPWSASDVSKVIRQLWGADRSNRALEKAGVPGSPWSAVSTLMIQDHHFPWWHHQMETFSTLLALCEGNSPVTGEFPSQRPVMWSFDVFFDLRVNRQFSKQLRCWWLETPSYSLWHHCNAHLYKGNPYTGMMAYLHGDGPLRIHLEKAFTKWDHSCQWKDIERK